MLSWRAHKSLSGQGTNKTGQDKASSQSQKSLKVEVRMGDQVGGLHGKLATKRLKILGALMFSGPNMGSPWLLSGFPGWAQGRKPIVIIVWRPRKDYHSSKRKSLVLSWADPERQHTADTVYGSLAPATEWTVTKSASKRVNRLWIPFLPPPPSHHGERQSPPQSCEKRKQHPRLCCFSERFHFRGDLFRGPSGAHESSGCNWPVGEKIGLKYLKIKREQIKRFFWGDLEEVTVK